MMRELLACRPQPRFPVISITGEGCAFNCRHCFRHYLAGMIACETPQKLYETSLHLLEAGARGVLLSGGFNPEGYVPFEPFLDAIERVKNETGLILSAHTGLPPRWLARELGRVGIDIADFDLVGDDESIELVMGSGKKARDYFRTMRILARFIPLVVPHICIGLHGGRVKGELRAIDAAAEMGPRLLVFLILNPTRGTPFEDTLPPPVEEVLPVLRRARERLPGTELALGCMRPRTGGRDKLELEFVRAGVTRIVLPSRVTLERAREAGFAIREFNACCSVPVEWTGELREG